MLKIYGYAASINVRKVLWLCAELGLEYQREDWGGGTRSVDDPAFRALNPAGFVPVIDDSGIVIFESNTILRYLAGRAGRYDLLPLADLGLRAQIEQWMDWQVSDFNNTWRYSVYALLRKDPNYADEKMIAESVQRFNRAVGVIDGQLARTRGHIAGAHFTLADIPIGLSLRRWYVTPLPERPDYPHVAAYYARLSERAGFKEFGLASPT